MVKPVGDGGEPDAQRDDGAGDPPGPERFERVQRDLGERISATLPNGLRVVIQQMADTDVVAARVYVGVGGMLEGEELGCGISHFCEHLLSAGTTTRRSEDDYRTIIDNIGGQENAYTTSDHTCYHITTTRPHADIAIEILGEWMQHAAITEQEFEREKNVIIREVEKGLTEPGRVFHRLYAETVFREHPWRIPVIGYPELVKGVTRERMVAFRDRHYHPANTVVSIAGGVEDPVQMLETVNRHWGHWPRRPQPPLMLPDEPRQVADRMATEASTLLHGDTSWLRMSWPTVSADHPDLYPLDVLSVILGHGEGSRLVRKLRDELRVVTSVSTSSWTPTWGRGFFSVTAFTPYDKLAAARGAIEREIRRCVETLPAIPELERAKTRKQASEVFGRQRAEDVAANLGFNAMFLGDLDYDDGYLDGIRLVHQAQVRDAAERYFKDGPLNTVAMFSRDVHVKAGSRDPFAPTTAGAAPAAKPQGTAETRLVTLETGLRVVLRAIPGTGTVALQSFSHGGLRYETGDTNGRFYAMARALVRGTAQRSAHAVTDAFDKLGGAIGGSAGNNTVGLSARFLADGDRLARGLRMFREVLTTPTFPDHEVAQLLDRQRLMIQRLDESWQNEATRRLRQQMFAGHPYAMSLVGTTESVNAITPDALRQLHDTSMQPGATVIGLVGDFELDAAAELVHQTLADWQPTAGAPSLPEAPMATPPTEEVDFRWTTSKDMAAIALAWAGPPWGHADGAVVDVIDAVTSGVNLPSGWLHEALRGGTNDFVYYVHAIPFTGLSGGMFYVLTQCHPSQREEVLGICRREMARIWTDEVTPDELDSAKRMCLISQAVDSQTNDARAAEIALCELYGKGYRYADGYADRINAVTAADVLRVAREWFTTPILVQCIPAEPGS